LASHCGAFPKPGTDEAGSGAGARRLLSQARSKEMTVYIPEQPSFGKAFDLAPKLGLFFAIQPDAGATDCLTRLMGQLRDDKTMLGRPVDPDRLHGTMLRLGVFADQTPPSLIPTADAAATTLMTESIEVVFDRVGGTGGPILLRGSDGLAALRAFQQTLKVALIKAGLGRYVHSVPEPHVTLSYDSRDAPERPIDPIGWTVRHFVLIESRLGKHQHIERGRWSIRN
jgi:RNA 2',3'-cyclic 3'-phosphodiesterase